MVTDRPGGGGNTDVFVQSFPPTGAKYQVSGREGGRAPTWSSDGTQLFFHSYTGNRFFVVDVRRVAARNAPAQINVVLNSFEELRTRAPAK